MKIITLTLNPAFDIHCEANHFIPYRESIVNVTSREAAGKGVNISRALAAFGRKNTAVVVVGNENGNEFCDMLKDGGLSFVPIFQSGRIRENITLHQEQHPETRVSFGGFALDETVLDQITDAIGKVDADTIITLTGSIPAGIPINALLDLLERAKESGAKIVIDSRSVTLAEILDFKPWLIKPNRDEIEQYTGKSIQTPNDAITIAKELCAQGVENAMISLGQDGAVLATASGSFHVQPPTIHALSTIGAGDSTIAGFIDAYCQNLSPAQCLIRAVAFGTAACMRDGTQPPIPSDAQDIESNITLKQT